jgi:hypothetical protein
MTPTIVVPAFNRPDSLERLLASLRLADYPDSARLVISVDRAAGNAPDPRNEAARQVALGAAWPHGPKEVIVHDTPQGLIGNVFFCGGLAERYGAVILLEDDLVVSRQFYRYAAQALDRYADDERIGGISLNALWFNGYTHQPFIPLMDGSDVFFLPVAWYQGQAYSAGQWARFREWLALGRPRPTADGPLHDLFAQFPQTDWFPIKTLYLVETGQVYAFPRESMTSNYGDAGTHFRRPTSFFQVPLQHLRQQFDLRPLDEALAVYDSFYELQPDRLARLTNRLSGIECDFDLYATKSARHLTRPWVLTTRPAAHPGARFGKMMRPLEANIIFNVAGEGIQLAAREEVDLGRAATASAQRDNDAYFNRYRRIGRRQRWAAEAAAWWDGVRAP